VQVGAFADREQAQERLDSVKQVLGAAALKTHPEFIMPVSLPSGATMFRARLSRFADEAQAKAACKRLKNSGIECWDIRAQ
jgi:D-alanyl-D-alanine carboxypeptidase